jgi:GH18 family chitinase
MMIEQDAGWQEFASWVAEVMRMNEFHPIDPSAEYPIYCGSEAEAELTRRLWLKYGRTPDKLHA